MHNGTTYYNKPVLEYMLVSDQKSSGTVPADGTGTNNARLRRTITTVDFNNITGASVSGLNTTAPSTAQITLPAGTYEIDGTVSSGLDVNFGQRVILYNVTDAVDAIKSLGTMLDSGAVQMHGARLRGVITITSPKVFAVDHYIRVGASNSLGYAVGESGVSETYLRLHIFKRY
jgi:hypothetical protein